MRLDHIAYRTADRKKTAQFFMDAFGYKLQQEFTIDFGGGDQCLCIALEPPEKVADAPWVHQSLATHPDCIRDDLGISIDAYLALPTVNIDYHMAPEIFVSDGTPNSIVGQWVAARGGIGGIHHLAYQVPSVEGKMKEWAEKGWGTFSSEKPFHCEGLTQVFSTPHALTGVIYEFIERTGFGFCKENVANLMRSSVEIDAAAK
jgi:catechol 2,3-dioxygenase-like lactoylglutathione lyase family enzyme